MATVYWCKPIITKDMVDAAANALQNEKFVMGESVFKFEEEFAKYCGVRFAISTSSGTNALQIALLGLGAAGHEVVTSASSFIATPNSIVHAGASPIFVDINGEYSLDLQEAQRAITKNTKVLLPVHLYGHPADMQELRELSEKNGIKILEDACQAHGAEYRGKKCGAIGDAGCFSFYSTKNMTVCGDGGMITTNDAELAKKMAKLRDCGRASQYVHDALGFTSRLNTVNAAIGRVQLKQLDRWNEHRRGVAAQYFDGLSDVPDVFLPPEENAIKKPCYYLFAISAKNRDALRDFLLQNNIQTGVNYPLSLNKQPIYADMCKASGRTFENSEQLSEHVLCLPMHAELRKDEVQLVCEKIIEFYRHGR